MTTIATGSPGFMGGRDEVFSSQAAAFDALSWRAVLVGAISALAVRACLTILGVAIGLAVSKAVATATTDPDAQGSAAAVGRPGFLSFALGGAIASHHSGTLGDAGEGHCGRLTHSTAVHLGANSTRTGR